MERFNANFIYTLGAAVDSLKERTEGIKNGVDSAVNRLKLCIECRYLKNQIDKLDDALQVSPMVRECAAELRVLLIELAPDGFLEDGEARESDELPPFLANPLRSSYLLELEIAISKFDTHLKGDFLEQNLYMVGRTGAYDVRLLLEQGEKMLTGGSDAVAKFPRAMEDIRLSARCLAFGLWTASGFHIARATESILREYWCNVRGQATLPKGTKTWVGLCRELQGRQGLGNKPTIPPAGDQALVSFLKSLGESYRNPLIHPEHSLDENDCGLLLEGCKASIVKMLALMGL